MTNILARPVITLVVDAELHVVPDPDDAFTHIAHLADGGAPVQIYRWDRACRESDDGAVIDYPPWGLRVGLDDGGTVGALNYHLWTDVPQVWDTLNTEPDPRSPTVWFDPDTPTAFRRSAVLPVDAVWAAVREHLDTGARPNCVCWQPAQHY